MNFINDFGLGGFGLKVLLLAAIVSVIEILVGIFRKKLPDFIAEGLPLAAALISAAAYDYIVNGNIKFSEELLYGGLTAYSVATLFTVAVKKIANGEKNAKELFLLVKSVLLGVCEGDAERETAEIIRIIKRLLSTRHADSNEIKNDLISLLQKMAKSGVSAREITAAAEAILLSATSLIKEK